MSQWNDQMKLMAAYGFNAPSAHEIYSDINYIDAFLFEKTTAADPESLVEDENEWPNLPPAPPPVSGYRPADVQGLACWNCGHFTIVGDPDNDGDLDGICELFETQAEATYTCDRFVAHADMNRQGPHTSWQEDMANMRRDAMGPSIAEMDYSDNSVLNLIHFATEAANEEDGLVWKDILRTGEWSSRPTGNGIVKKPLQVVRNGLSKPFEGIISLSEVLQNFNEKAVPYVTVPLSDDKDDHKNIARVNTGYVRKLKIVDRDDGYSVLRAGFDFTEPDVKEKVLRGTIPDVSAGIPFGVTRREDNKLFGAVLDHVCLTRKPFVSDLGPFGIAAADGGDLPVEAWEQEEAGSELPSPHQDRLPPNTSESENESEPEITLSFRQASLAIRNALTNQLRLGPDYRIDDIAGTVATIAHHTSRSKWEVPFRITGNDSVIVASIDKWKLVEEKETPQENVTASDNRDELTKARELRELRLSQPTTTGGIQMSALSLEGVELSNLDENARNRIQTIIDENARLARRARENDVDKRITELEGLGLKDRPGALKFYREVMLSDDGMPACVLFADGDENKKQPVSAVEILDRFIEALKGTDGVQFSDQHFQSGNDIKPSTDTAGEKEDLETRVANMQTSLYGDKSKRRTGRK